MRLFVAVDPPEDVGARLADLDRPAVRRLRWTTPEQWHVTLRFLGQVDEASLGGPDGLIAALGTVPVLLAEGASGPVEAVMGPALSWFPGRHVLQVPVEGLADLAGAVARATASWGSAPEQSFLGHLTLARTRGSARGPAALAGVPVSARWVVPEVVLYSSVPGRGGSRYQVLERVPLPG